jgi:hypothetical protein
MSNTVDVFNPRARHTDPVATGGTTIPNLNGATVGILENTKPNACLLMSTVAQTLSESIPNLRVTVERKRSAAEGVDEDTRKRLAASANVIFTGSGD